ncbi:MULTISPECIES: GMC family oxidoreductase N-terminal domain-containing protein [Rhodomicrobium]|uniref:GMC family oxidoreductase n=1 Tax=Rhodomicrobium TaxID=1068 RepID=UPI000B4AAE64|nr:MULTISPECIES: GMC family oxidoreductase N-terminal domain-containing protein [Rhodomicrobium]
MQTKYDYVIVGAGSSGCVVANRLSANPRLRILLVEAGPVDSNWLIKMPRGVLRLIGRLNEPHSSYYHAARGGNHEPERWQKGRTLGGSSSINGMVYVRGHPLDYDGWEAAGCTGWGWSQMKRVFDAMETVRLADRQPRGNGPLKVTIPGHGNRLTEALIAAANGLGVQRVPDNNEAPDGGIGYQPQTIWNGRRQSAAVAFLRPVSTRENLDVVTDTRAVRVLFDGRRVTGVILRDRTGDHRIGVGRELILCSGAIESPKLLQLSGIGPAALLQRMNVDVVQDSPNVGRNLREHLILPNVYRVQEGSRNPQYRGWRLPWNILRYALRSDGPMSVAIAEVAAYVKTREGLAKPDVQVGVGLQSFKVTTGGLETLPGKEISLVSYFMHPRSRGSIEISAPDPSAPPIVDANYLSEQEDRDTLVATIRFTRRLMTQPPLRGLVISEEVPGAPIGDDGLVKFYAEAGATGYHVSCTCRMGGDTLSVVDPRLRVRGVEGLRVIDTSVMPELPSGNTNGPAMAIGWRGAELILEDLAAEQVRR